MRPPRTEWLLAPLANRVRPPRAVADPVPDPLPASDYEPVATDAGQLWISSHDRVMRPFMKKVGRWEPEEGDLLRSLVRSGTRFLDVGANIGYFSILVSKAAPGVRVDAVEPHPANVRALRFNLWANQVTADVWPVALDDRDRTLQLDDNATNFGDFRSGRVESVGGESEWTPEAGALFVPAASGEDLFGDRSFDLVKIDVQGWEFEVLTGLESVLRRSSVQIVLEFWPHSLRTRQRDPVDVLRRYRDLGYAIRVSLDRGLRSMPDEEIVWTCESGGETGQVNLLLER